MVKGFLKPSAGAGTTQKILQDHPDDSSFEDSMVRKQGGSGLAQSKTKEKIRIPLEIWKHTLHTYTYTHRFPWTHTHIHIHIYTHTHIHEKFLFHVRQAESKWTDDVINQTPISHVPSYHQLTEVGVQQACTLRGIETATVDGGFVSCDCRLLWKATTWMTRLANM